MRILLSNDDGVYAPGIRALAEAFKGEHEVCICAPDSERSGAGHSFTYLTPLWAKKVFLAGLEDVLTYAVSGTPADSVRLGFGNLFPAPDLVISGINLSSNLGTDVFYSGTVSAAMEAALCGVKAIAISNIADYPTDYSGCIAAVRLVMELMERNPGLRVVNVNAPDASKEELKGLKAARLGRVDYCAKYEQGTDPAGRPYYWATATRVNSFEPGGDTDERWVNEGYASITPLLSDLTDEAALSELKSALEDIK